MTSFHVSAILGVSRRYIFRLKKQFPESAPAGFDDLAGWRTFVSAHRIAPTTAREVGPRATRKSSKSVPTDATTAAHAAAAASYSEARARKTHYAAQLAWIQLGVIKREMVPREEVKALLVRIASVVR